MFGALNLGHWDLFFDAWNLSAYGNRRLNFS
jgi:hypothetical protein